MTRAKTHSLRKCVEKISVENRKDCIPWPFRSKTVGYGCLNVAGRRVYAHRYVCTLRHGPPPSENLQAAHLCGNRACCNPLHIRWATPSENCLDKSLHGKDSRGESNPKSVLTADQVRAIRDDPQPQAVLAKEYSVSVSAINRIKTRSTWKHL
jgi:hypothetical protein